MTWRWLLREFAANTLRSVPRTVDLPLMPRHFARMGISHQTRAIRSARLDGQFLPGASQFFCPDADVLMRFLPLGA